jgi:hypothetical protein
MATERRLAPLGVLPAVVLLILGVPFLCLGLHQAWDAQERLAQYEVAEGTVTGNEVWRTNDPEGSAILRASYHPIVRFTTQNGETLEFTDAAGTQSPSYEVGDPVNVLYDPYDPGQARVRSWNLIWQTPVTNVALGLFPILVLVLWGAWSHVSAKPHAGR